MLSHSLFNLVEQADPLNRQSLTATPVGHHPPTSDYVTLPPHAERRRRRCKYAEGELAEDKSFYFRGPDSPLNLWAQNLNLFVQIRQGVDDRTWLYHPSAPAIIRAGSAKRSATTTYSPAKPDPNGPALRRQPSARGTPQPDTGPRREQ
jgi:hypothetical protein